MYNNDCCGVQCQQITKQSSSCIITTFVDDCCRMKNQGRERIKNVSKDKRQRAKGKNSMFKYISVRFVQLLTDE